MKRLMGLALGLSIALPALPAAADDALHQQEAQIGEQVYQQLSNKGEIVPRASAGPAYAVLDPIAARIKSVADPQYDFPFQFILVHEAQPNAFAVPGGRVYVTDSLMKFVQNKEELAGVLCHETSHDIHHDVIHNNAKDQTLGTAIGVIGALTGLTNSGVGQLGANLAYTLQSDHFSRQVESAADHKGAETCAQAGINPWGMVWLFQNFEKADTGGHLEALSDHPSDVHRIDALQAYFSSDRSLFGRYSPDIASATPLRSADIGMRAPVKRTARRTVRHTGPYCCAPKGNAVAGRMPHSAQAPTRTATDASGAATANGDGTTVDGGTVYGP